VNGTGKFTGVLELAPSGIKLNGNTYSSALIDASLSIPKLPESSVSNKTLDGNFKTLKVMDTAVITDISGKLDSSKAVADKTLDGNFKTLKVMDTAVDHRRLRETEYECCRRQDPGR
jgi:hypothetical protein